jgi:hypothetical protein
MSTRSFICKSLPNNTVVGVYCHFDGYPSGVGATLSTHYTTTPRVDALLSLGSISQLKPRLVPDLGVTHTFDNPAANVTVAYHRDRGEAMSSTTFPSLDVMVANVADQLGVEFVYIWDGNEWVTMDLTLNSDFSFETVQSD